MTKKPQTSEIPFPDTIPLDRTSLPAYIISDLHLSGGKGEDGKYRSTENFFYDEKFANFLRHIQDRQTGSKTLIVNGDFIDFIRLIDHPPRDQFPRWLEVLKKAGIQMAEEDLSVNEREIKFGLKTHEYKSVWKMDFVMSAHRKFFTALADFLQKGNKLVVIQGNHDMEFVWPAVRRIFVRNLMDLYSPKINAGQKKSLETRILFCRTGCFLGETVYVEHGNQYEKLTAAHQSFLPGEKELCLPIGSLINRYFLNKVEDLAPYMDNIRPVTAYVDSIFKNYPLRSLGTIIGYIPLTWEMMKKNYYWESLKLIGKLIKYSLFPVSLILLMALPSMVPAFKAWLAAVPVIGNYLATMSGGAVISILSFLLPFFWPSQSRKKDIQRGIKEIGEKYPGVKHMVLGHFHEPDMMLKDGLSYTNCGTWTPMIDVHNKLESETRFGVVLVDKGAGDTVKKPLLRQWSSCTGKLEQIILIESIASVPRGRRSKS